MKISAALALGVLLAPTAANATPPGSLTVERHCSSPDATISIVSDPNLSQAAIEGSTGGIDTSGGRLHVTASCSGNDLSIRIPPKLAVDIDQSGAGELRLGDLDGRVTVQLRGDGGLNAGHLTGGLTLEAAGNADVHIAALTGDATIDIYGSGDLTLGSIDTPALSVTQTGDGDVAIGSGRIGKLMATVSGSGDLTVGATVGGGTVVSTGSGDTSIKRVVGALVQTQTGSGDIKIGARATSQSPESRPLGKTPQIASSDDLSGSTAAIEPLEAVTVLLFLGAAGATIWLAARRRRGDPVAREPNILAAVGQLEVLARRVGHLEALVTSREFELHRSFRDIADSKPDAVPARPGPATPR